MSIFNFFLCLLTLTSVFACANTDNIQLKLDQIPSQDVVRLERFFRHFVTYESFGYVIFGRKPMVLSEISTDQIYIDIENPKIIEYNYLLQDYYTWNKYKHLFPFKNYTLHIFYNKITSDYDVVLINRHNCLETIQKHMQLFKEKLGASIKSKEILHKLETNENLLEEVLKDNDDLLGILLGFGENNSRLFQKRKTLNAQGKYKPPFDPKKVESYYQIKLTPTNFQPYFSPISFIHTPFFVEDRDSFESKRLRQEYINMLKDQCKLYYQGHFLKITLENLMK